MYIEDAWQKGYTMKNKSLLDSLQLDIHTHSLISGHAYGTIREMA